MLGVAWQMGRVPLTREALLRAIELNGVQVERNRAAFEWGRRCAHDLASVEALLVTEQVIEVLKRPSLDALINRRVELLTAYQSAAYASQYRVFVERVRAAEAPLGSTRLTEAVAIQLHRLMAYKDEYEVARLHTDPAFIAGIAAQFEGDFKLVHHLAPPGLSSHNDKGELVKRPFGPWVRPAMKLLARLKSLRGTALDPFGYTAERRMERAWIERYRQGIEGRLPGLSAETLPQALELARLPEQLRGFGHVKARNEAQLREGWDRLLQTLKA
jgi:indolepyruvate ferredoxin oxidoreductase